MKKVTTIQRFDGSVLMLGDGDKKEFESMAEMQAFLYGNNLRDVIRHHHPGGISMEMREPVGVAGPLAYQERRGRWMRR